MKKILTITFFIPTLIFILSGCYAPKSPQPPSPPKTLILVSVPPYQSIVQQIAGESFRVTTVVPPNADPHTYEPTARQLTEITEGRLWFQIGEPFEKKLMPLLPNAEPLDLREGLAMIHSCCAHDSHKSHESHETMDRHIWLSPKMVAYQIDTISAALSSRYPEQQESFTSRGLELRERVTALNTQIETRLHNTVTRSFLISHPAFAYFCRDFGCNQLSVEQEGKEPRPKELEELLASAVHSGTRLAIAIPQHNNKGAQLIADKLKIPIRVLDPYAKDCMETMRILAELIENPYQIDSSL
jgi:zinc transport system substrate-binding protein